MTYDKQKKIINEESIKIFKEEEQKMLFGVSEKLTAISCYNVYPVEHEGSSRVKINLQGIYIHSYKAFGKTTARLKEFEDILTIIFEFLKEHNVEVYGKPPTRANAMYAYYFWVTLKN